MSETTVKKQLLDQERAADSLRKVRSIQGEDPARADEYANYTERLPADILINGLGQALAQLNAAAKRNTRDPHYLLYRDIQAWLCREDPLAPFPGAGDLLTALVECDRFTYLRAQAEAMVWLEWHKKLAVAYLKRTEGETM
jgi:CRISPR-associated protein Cmr5